MLDCHYFVTEEIEKTTQILPVQETGLIPFMISPSTTDSKAPLEACNRLGIQKMFRREKGIPDVVLNETETSSVVDDDECRKVRWTRVFMCCSRRPYYVERSHSMDSSLTSFRESSYPLIRNKGCPPLRTFDQQPIVPLHPPSILRRSSVVTMYERFEPKFPPSAYPIQKQRQDFGVTTHTLTWPWEEEKEEEEEDNIRDWSSASSSERFDNTAESQSLSPSSVSSATVYPSDEDTVHLSVPHQPELSQWWSPMRSPKTPTTADVISLSSSRGSVNHRKKSLGRPPRPDARGKRLSHHIAVNSWGEPWPQSPSTCSGPWFEDSSDEDSLFASPRSHLHEVQRGICPIQEYCGIEEIAPFQDTDEVDGIDPYAYHIPSPKSQQRPRQPGPDPAILFNEDICMGGDDLSLVSFDSLDKSKCDSRTHETRLSSGTYVEHLDFILGQVSSRRRRRHKSNNHSNGRRK